jgi:auxin efflux carrier family protein
VLIVGIAVKPVLKLVVIAAAGALLAKKGTSHNWGIANWGRAGHLNSAVLKGMSAVAINVWMPCLLFSKTVPSFTSDNVSEIGVLILTAVFYQCAVHLRCGG